MDNFVIGLRTLRVRVGALPERDSFGIGLGRVATGLGQLDWRLMR